MLSKKVVLPAVTAILALATACGGSATSTPAASLATSTPTSTATSPVDSPTATATVAATPTSTATPSAGGEDGGAKSFFVWDVRDIDEGVKPALALDSQGIPLVAYMLEDLQGFVKGAVLKGNGWDITTVAEGYFYGPLDLAIGPDDVGHVAYHDHQDTRFDPSKGDAVYGAFRDGNWDVQTIFDRGHDGWDNRIVVDSNGVPHMSAIDPEDFNGNGVEYYYSDPNGEWRVVEIGSGPLTYRFSTSIGISLEGVPHITYYDQNSLDLRLAVKGPSGWEISTVDADGDTGLFSSLVVNKVGSIHISYLEKTGSSAGIVKYATKGTSETEWQITEIGTLEEIRFGFTGARNITSLALDSQGNPWIAYSDEAVLKLAVWDGSLWQMETVIDADSRPLGQLVSLKLDSEDQPHIAFFEVTNSNPLEGMVKYAKGTRSG